MYEQLNKWVANIQRACGYSQHDTDCRNLQRISGPPSIQGSTNKPIFL